MILGGIAVHSWYAEVQQQVERIHPAVLDWSAEAVQHRLVKARDEIVALGRAPASASSESIRWERARESLSSSPTFSGIVLLDEQDHVRESAGKGPAFARLIETLTTKDAIQADLLTAMNASQLRSELGAAESGSLRLYAVDEQLASVLASVALVDRRGRQSGSLHGLVRSAELSASLRSDLLGTGALHLADREGRVVAQAGDVVPSQESFSSEALHAPANPHVNVPWDADDAWTVRSARPAGALDMAIIAEQPILLAFESMLLTAIQMVAAAAVLIVMFTLIASLVAVASTRRLQALLDGIRAIAKSDFATRLPEGEARGQIGFIYRSFNEMAKGLTKSRTEYEARVESLSSQNVGFQRQHESLAKLSVTDALTELHNHRYFQDQLGLEIKRMSRTNEGLSMLIVDIDDFKKLNDSYGHAAGDEFLKQLARILTESVRETDLLARYGGEEFVVIAVGTLLDGARLLAEKLRTKVAETSFIVDKTMRPRSVTVSIGVAQYVHSRTELFTAADAALYRAKAAGKNCVVVAEPHATDGLPE